MVVGVASFSSGFATPLFAAVVPKSPPPRVPRVPPNERPPVVRGTCFDLPGTSGFWFTEQSTTKCWCRRPRSVSTACRFWGSRKNPPVAGTGAVDESRSRYWSIPVLCGFWCTEQPSAAKCRGRRRGRGSTSSNFYSNHSQLLEVGRSTNNRSPGFAGSFPSAGFKAPNNVVPVPVVPPPNSEVVAAPPPVDGAGLVVFPKMLPPLPNGVGMGVDDSPANKPPEVIVEVGPPN